MGAVEGGEPAHGTRRVASRRSGDGPHAYDLALRRERDRVQSGGECVVATDGKERLVGRRVGVRPRAWGWSRAWIGVQKQTTDTW